ncbi:hypothetical protein ACFQ9X_42395 [Catenulispora yoronensis]
MGALDGAGTRPGQAAVPGPRYRMRDADEAVAAGLLDTDPATGEFTFRHPLVRASVVQMATPTSAAPPTAPWPTCTGTTWSGTRRTWRRPPSTPTRTWRGSWSGPPDRPPGAAAPWPP